MKMIAGVNKASASERDQRNLSGFLCLN